jgi:glycosyltransferase involved in cell wall biosynthesis
MTLVSCVMPTKDRRSFIPAALDCWQKQTYENRELIVVDDGSDSIEDLIPKDSRIRYVRAETPSWKTTGAKRNYCNSLAQGEIICHWDDDDFSTPDRIQFQVDLLRASGKPISGFGALLFWDVISQQTKRYTANTAGYVCGTTLCYLKSYWEEHWFPDKQVASDNRFIFPALKQIAASSDESHMVARIHSQHTSAKTGIRTVVDRNLIPASFWENEQFRLQ